MGGDARDDAVDSSAPVVALDTSDTAPPFVPTDTGTRPAMGTYSGPMMLRADPGRTGRYPGPPPALGEIAWVADSGPICTVPAATSGRAFIADGRVVGAVSLEDGSTLWGVGTGAEVRGGVSVADDRVFVGDRLGTVTAFDAADGSVLWTATGTGACGHAAVGSDGLYIACGELFLLDLQTGDVLQSTPFFRPEDEQGPTLTDTLVVLGGGPTQAFERDGFEERWGADLGTTRATAATDSEHLFLSTLAGTYAVGTNQGAVIWALDGVASLVDGSPALVDGVVYGTVTRGVRAREADTGRELWTRLLPDTPVGAVAAAGSAVFVSDTAGRVHAISRSDGALRWSTEVGACSPPALVDGLVLVGTEQGLTALR